MTSKKNLITSIRTAFLRYGMIKGTYVIISLLILLLVLLMALQIHKGLVDSEVKNRQFELLSITTQLDQRLRSSDREALKQLDSVSGKKNLSKEDRLKINESLQPAFDAMTALYPDIGMGYYDLRVDSVLAIAPDFEPSRFMEVTLHGPFFESYATGKPEFTVSKETNNWPGVEALNVTLPFYLEGRIIGHIWANVNINDVYISALSKASELFFFGVILWGLVLYIIWYFTKKIEKELSAFSEAVVTGNKTIDVGRSLPELSPLLKVVRDHAFKLKRFASIVEHSNDAIFDSCNDVITSWNPAAEHIFGYSAEEMIGQNDRILIPKEPHKDTQNEVQKEAEKLHLIEVERVKKNGEKVWVSMSISPIKDDNGQCIGGSIIARDISERKRIEHEMARVDQLNLIGEMAAGISHEVRNPMTTVRGFLQIIGSKPDLLPYKDFCDLMIEELDRANAIISEFLSLSRNVATEFEFKNLNKIVRTILPLLEANAVKDEHIIRFEPGDIPDLPLNEKEIRQIVYNLTQNGLEAMPSGGSLFIRTFQENEEVILQIQDQGKGIPEEVLEKIGTPFFTTKEKGTGLGLAVCYGIVGRHGAKIRIQSSSAGTSFFVCFTVVSSEMERGTTGENPVGNVT